MSHSGLLPSSIWKHAVRAYRELPNQFPLHPVSTLTIRQTSWCMGALNLLILPLKWCLQTRCGICRCVGSWVVVCSAGCQWPATKLMHLYWHDQRIAHVRSEVDTWKTSRLHQKERTPLDNVIFECGGWTETAIACEEFYFAQPLKLWNSSQHKKWKRTHQRTDSSFMNQSGSSRISAKIKLHPCMNHITFYHKSSPF